MEDFLLLDAKVYPAEYQVTRETTIRRLNTNPYTDITVRDEEGLIGYISLCPIEKSIFNQIKRQEISENDIEQNIVPFDQMGVYDAYLSSIVVDKIRYPRFKGIFLFHYLQNHLKKLKQRGIFIDRIIAVAVSAGGKRVLQKMHFTEVHPNIFVYSCLKEGCQLVKIPFDFPSLYTMTFASFSRAVFKKLPFMYHSHDLHIWDWDSDT